MTSHERFGTAKLQLDGHELDLAGARSETYPHPGALPVVRAGAQLEQDLARRDFTVNAMAIPLHGDPELIDPYGGEADLASKRLRVLHNRSFVDDPTDVRDPPDYIKDLARYTSQGGMVWVFAL